MFDLNSNYISVDSTDQNKNYSFIQSEEEYESLYKKSIETPDEFWKQIAKNFFWKSFPKDYICSHIFDTKKGTVFSRWMAGTITNVSYNLLDRNIKNGFGESIAYIWESQNQRIKKQLTYSQLLSKVCKFANMLLELKIKKGDRIAIYMPVTIEFVVAMLACIRIGALHVAIFAGLSAKSLADRIITSKCHVLVTVDGAIRCEKFINFKSICNHAIALCEKKNFFVKYCIVKNQLIKDKTYSMNHDIKSMCRYLSWDNFILNVSDYCEPVWLSAENYLFLLFTSGSTGRPKCIVHTAADFLLWSYTQSKYIFNGRPGEVFFTTSDLGWIVSHIFCVYGALATTCTVVLIEGSPFYPNLERVWKIIDSYNVNTFQTTPTVIRNLKNGAHQVLTKFNRDSLRLLCFGGENIDLQVWHWFWSIVGQKSCTLVSHYGQTETGSIINHYPACIPIKPVSAGRPMLGLITAIVDSDGNELQENVKGYLVIKKPWPGLATTIYGKHNEFVNTYFRKFPGYYYTGDVALKDIDGYYWIFGRDSDMVKVSDRLLSLLEIEYSILEHKAVAEAIAVSASEPVKGKGIHVFIVLHEGFVFEEQMDKSIKQIVNEKIGGLARPDKLHVVSSLPKTITGKSLRRILTKVCAGSSYFGDTSMIANEWILSELKQISH